MWLSRENGHFDVSGSEVFVRKGVLYPDGDPAVRAMPQIFDQVSEDTPKSTGPRRVPSALKGKPDG